MKRIAAIVGIVLSVAIVVGAFIIGGGDDASEAKSPASEVNLAKKTGQSITNAGTKVQSAGPVTTADDDDDDDDENEGKYETRRVFVSVAPNTVRVGRTFNIQVRGFTPGTIVLVSIAGNPQPAQITVDKQGRGKSKGIAAPSVGGTYTVIAVGPGAPGKPEKFATTTLTVTNKK